ncbi:MULTISPECIES: EscU/YscU/HrcU family type III secretion system export apparatus switch protein [Fictibacillus]|jgi:flagellar biosynthesis protein|uniref:EscU/YscU/HrcU family type III secretion system export apparatus switch protein n=1 Tax=Fictibacillus TaxID=1329200 RepID=UPI0018CDBEB6|nr:MULTISPECIES: EscU/YscU/HrcU family type III secretion system export apparatus switch protein [unclassified Fictibacillus]MBH0155865.1 EscU/YscU/HrcU family type III secretion system export apparatus switch protein [Fictibacillus sp. 5RED26]MBH0173058.1 EscU/YscU/HrcU family type III secretion system export apparatus switch protein [Fictibacillus sp. 23RED33]
MSESKKEAVALKYSPLESNSPVVIAKGKGETAERILRSAENHDIPIQEDPSLVHLLSKLEIDESIPEELYEVVAELFAFIYKLDKEAGETT